MITLSPSKNNLSGKPYSKFFLVTNKIYEYPTIADIIEVQINCFLNSTPYKNILYETIAIIEPIAYANFSYPKNSGYNPNSFV